MLASMLEAEGAAAADAAEAVPRVKRNDEGTDETADEAAANECDAAVAS